METAVAAAVVVGVVMMVVVVVVRGPSGAGVMEGNLHSACGWRMAPMRFGLVWDMVREGVK